VALLCTLPWLNPFGSGPVPSVLPWLCSLACVAAAVLVSTHPLPPPTPSTGSWWYTATAMWLGGLALWPRSAPLLPYEALALISGLALIGLGKSLARNDRLVGPLWCVVLPWILAGLVSSVIALLQYFGHSAGLAPWVNWAPAGEAFANLRQRNQFASLTSLAVAAMLGWWLLAAHQARRPHSWLVGAGLALLVVGNAASASRTGLLQLVVLVIMVGWWRRDARTLAWLAGLVAIYALAVFLLPWAAGLDPHAHGMFARLREGDALCSSRLTLWRNVLDLIAQRPWLGWGWGELDYAHYVTLYDGPRFCDILDNAHNLPLHLAVELGIPAAVVVCGALLVWVLRSRPWQETDPTRRTAWLAVAVLGLHSLLEYPLWYGPFQLAFGLSLGLLWRPRVASDGRPSRTPWPTAALAGAALVAVAYAAWDYHRISQVYLPPALRAPAYRDDSLAQAQRSWLFTRQVQFAVLGLTELTPASAPHVHALALDLLHFSPEPRVIEKLLDSARMLGLEDERAFHAARFKAAFPDAHARWAAAQAR
jgi:hypothetical protein